MPLADLLRPEQRQWLRRLRRRIANREVMRRHRAANRDKRLCAGVDLPLDAGTCGRLVWPAHERCYACHVRRQWLLALAARCRQTVAAAMRDAGLRAAAAGPAPAPTSETPAVEAILLRRQVQRIGSNLNQACRRLHALDGDHAAAVAAVERAADAVGRFLEAIR